MRLHFLVVLLLAFMLIVPARAQDQVDSASSPVEVQPDTSESVVSVPVDEQTGTVLWQEYLSLPSGGGARFGFVTVLYPPDPAALADCPEILLDGAWFPPIPFAFSFEPPVDAQASTRGWWYLEDASGNLARRDMDITAGNDTWFCSTWFMGGGWAFHIERGWLTGYFAEEYYLPDEWGGPGIDFFIRNVWFHGILGGERMQRLLEVCGAQRIGRDLINAGRDRLAIFMVPANEVDRQNGRGSLLVWVTVGDWRLVRTRLHAAYAIEMTEFYNVSADVSNDPQVYDSDYLPADVYLSIDQYLLTHATPFFGVGSDVEYFGAQQSTSPYSAQSAEGAEESTESNTEEQDDDAGDSEEGSEG